MAALTTHDIKETVRESVEATMPPAVQKYVNGNIKRVEDKLDGHINTMQPVADFIATLNNLIRFCKWAGIPTVALLAGLVAFIKHIV